MKHNKLVFRIGHKAVPATNGLKVGETDVYAPPQRRSARFFIYVAIDNTIRVGRYGKPYKVQPKEAPLDNI